VALCLYFGLRGLIAIAASAFVCLPIYFIVYVAIGLAISPPLELFPGDDDFPKESTDNS
jgi:hypothetical protein